LIGDSAKNASHQYPKQTIYEIKRFIGREFKDPILQRDLKLLSYNVVDDNNKPKVEVEYSGETKRFTPEEISAMILGKMKDIAESYLGNKVTDCVVTVPAYFNDSQRNATKDAGRIIGLNILRIINEPTAAAIAYGLDKKDGKSRNIIVFDCGGGTHDVSVLNIEDGVFEVKATGGDTHLGGSDFDQRLVQHFLQEFQLKHKISLDDNKKAIRRLATASEKAKRALSSSTSTSVEVDSIYQGIDFNTTLTRAKFESLCMDLFHKTMVPVEQVLQDSKLSKSEIDEIVLVGGSTRIPKIRELLTKFFNGKELCNHINPDEAVAYGAAVQAALLSGNKDEKINDILLLDVNPLSLGVETQGSVMTVLIPRGTTIPTRKKDLFSTGVDNQRSVTIKVFEGERKLTRDCNLLGTFNLDDIPAMPRGVPQIEISYELDADGILKVSAVEKSSGKSKEITIKNESNKLSKDEIERMIKEAEQFKEHDKKIAERIEAKNALESYVYHTKTSVEEKDNQSKLSDEDVTLVKSVVTDTLQWIETGGDSLTTEDFTKKKSEVESSLVTVLAKLYGPSSPPETSQSSSPPETSQSTCKIDELD